jgi:hypothetical protein
VMRKRRCCERGCHNGGQATTFKFMHVSEMSWPTDYVFC